MIPQPFSSQPETFAAPGFSDLRTGFVLRDESSRRRRCRAPHGSGRAAPEHDPDSPELGTRPPPLAILRNTNQARISEEPDARDRTRGTGRAGPDRTRGRPPMPAAANARPPYLGSRHATDPRRSSRVAPDTAQREGGVRGRIDGADHRCRAEGAPGGQHSC